MFACLLSGGQSSQLIDENIPPPSITTLRKYGLSAEEWLGLLREQGWVCAICGNQPNPNKKTGKIMFQTDHEHVKGWSKKPPEVRKGYVRAITCWYCNKNHLGRGMTLEKAKRLVIMMEKYEQRKRDFGLV